MLNDVMIVHNVSQTLHTITLQKCAVPLYFMIDHCNFQEWL